MRYMVLTMLARAVCVLLTMPALAQLEFIDETSGKPSSLSRRSAFVTLTRRFR